MPGFSGPVSRLAPLTKKNAKFIWKEEHQQALDEIKKLFTTPPVLKPPEFGRPFLVITDASDYAIGSALIQIHNGKECPV